MSHTDFITFFLSIFFLVRGASRGFMLSALIPFSIIVATIISIIYYQFTKDWAVVSIIALISPFFLYILFKFLLSKWAKATNTEIRPEFLSRLGGSMLYLAWGWVFISFTLIVLAVLPPWGKGFIAIRNNVTQSASYYFIAKPEGMSFFAAVTADDPSLSNKISSFFFPGSNRLITPSTKAPLSPDVKSLAEDPRFQILLKDLEIQREIDAHDFVSLMSNPKIIDLTQHILRDPATLKKVMALYSNQTELRASWAPSEPSQVK